MDQEPRELRGIGVSPGIVVGKAHLLEQEDVSIPYYTLPDEQAVEEEIRRFECAVVKTERDLEAILERVHPDLRQHSQVLVAHKMMLRDRLVYDQTVTLIREERLNARWALMRAVWKARELFESIQDEYLRNRVDDLSSVTERLLRNLAGQDRNALEDIRSRVIIVAHDLGPADTAQIQLERTLALVTDLGGSTSHTSIIARSLGIPTVVGTEQATRRVKTGDLLIVDGSDGRVIVQPSEDQVIHYTERQDQLETYLAEIRRRAHHPARTTDGYLIRVEANIELLEELVAAKDNGAEGIGLFRTEFSFMNRTGMPDEEELFNEYREVAELMAPQSVTLRTLDLGAEKLAGWLPQMEQANPALGLRSIRLCLRYEDVFRMQVRAILRASAFSRNIRVMFPLISGVGELREAKRVLNEEREKLVAKGVRFHASMPIGIMIEIPSAVAVADLLAAEVDFFSVGTNDLIQYSLGIDRVNELVAYLYEPLHPGVLRLIKQVVDIGHRARIPVSVCGEMAGEPLYSPILLGLEVDSISMNSQSVPRVKNLICRSTMTECKSFLDRALRMKTAQEISRSLQDMVLQKFPEEFKLFSPSGLASARPAQPAPASLLGGPEDPDGSRNGVDRNAG
jgi:phosphotransferase system enzyme I (PtsI)